MNAKEMRDMHDEELAEHITTVRKDLFGKRFANATGELEDTASVRRARRELARALTVVSERNALRATSNQLTS
ncbi:MAG TPA: 50S ribosomal protein L29 [Solirubrobacteraceae bacterium]|jgi:large subunit ribosomal protein L29|nr:50S ribosomal protein L29 [Solirubrobacteraceae bacterium]